jgi:hypothetical protein
MAFEKYKGKKYSQVRDQDTTKKVEAYKKIPANLRFGNKSRALGGFFDYDLVLKYIDKSKGDSRYQENAIYVDQDPDTGDTFVGVNKEIFDETIENVFTDQLSSTAATQVSNSFFNESSGLGFAVSQIPESERYVGILVSSFEPGSSPTPGDGTFGIITASLDIVESPGVSAGSRQQKIRFNNNSVNYFSSNFKFANSILDTSQLAATTALVNAGSSSITRSFDSNGFHLVQPTPVVETTFFVSQSKPGYSSNTSSIIALTSSFSSSDTFGVTSGSIIAQHKDGQPFTYFNYNGINANDGEYTAINIKGFVEGEGSFNEGESNATLKTFLAAQDVIFYSREENYNNIRSASFYFYPSHPNPEDLLGDQQKIDIRDRVQSASISPDRSYEDLRTVYWFGHTYTSSFIGAFGGGLNSKHQLKTDTSTPQLPFMPSDSYLNNLNGRNFGISGRHNSGSHLWQDIDLSVPADEGYYIHSQSFSLKENTEHITNMASVAASSALSGSTLVYGVFKNINVDSPADILEAHYTASHQSNTNKTLSSCPKISCIFITPPSTTELIQLFPEVSKTVLYS